MSAEVIEAAEAVELIDDDPAWLMREALALARRGYRVLPLFPNKSVAGDLIPYEIQNKTVAEWSTKDPERIRAWWTKAPSNMVGVVTGSASRLLVFDIDPLTPLGAMMSPGCATAHDSLAKLGVKFPPGTRRVQTPNGEHIWMRLAPGVRVRSSSSRLAMGVDVRADPICARPLRLFDQCYIVAAGVGYRPNGLDPKPAPARVVELAKRAAATKCGHHPKLDRCRKSSWWA